MTSILLAEDHQIVREGLRALLAAEPDFRVVGEASQGLEAVDLATTLKPDVLITDLMMPGMNGLEVTRLVRQRAGKTRVIVLSMHATESYVTEALRSGASGYVLKDASASELVQAVRDVMAGRRYLSAALTERAIEAYIEHAGSVTRDVLDTLTPREREIMQLTVEGFSVSDIAARLWISAKTVETHRTNLMKKLGAHNRTDLIRFALQRGLLPMAPADPDA